MSPREQRAPVFPHDVFPDSILLLMQWTDPLHFINTPDWACNFTAVRLTVGINRNCYQKVARRFLDEPRPSASALFARRAQVMDCQDNMCVYGAILNFTERLEKESGTQQVWLGKQPVQLATLTSVATCVLACLSGGGGTNKQTNTRVSC